MGGSLGKSMVGLELLEGGVGGGRGVAGSGEVCASGGEVGVGGGQVSLQAGGGFLVASGFGRGLVQLLVEVVGDGRVAG